MSTLSQLAKSAHRNAVDKGFWLIDMAGPDDATTRDFIIVRCLSLIHCEVSEAVEALRRGDEKALGEELADIIIRTIDLSEALDIHIEEAIIAKMAKNENREHKHGKLF